MDLAELRFKVDTKQLEDAALKIEALGIAVQKLNKPLSENATATAKVVKEHLKTEEAVAKAAAATEKLQSAQDKNTESTKKSLSVLEKQNLILEYMAQGNSRGQASIMATYKAAGALDDQMLELNNTLKTQRTLIGGDPFDKSIGLMQKLQNEYKNTSEVTALFNRNLGLTEKQMTDIAREKQRLIALYKIEGKDINGLSAEYENLIKQSVEINTQNDLRTNSMKSQIKAVSDTAKANEYLTKELYRVDSALKQENLTLSSGTNNALLRFEKALKSSGLTASEQTTKLEAYRQKLLQLQKASGDRQVDYLSRALGPQITDIAVGLATGQNPLTVMLQQGGQLRDQFALAGVAGKDMGEMLKTAAASMVTSVKDVAMAVGGLLVSSFVNVGRTILSTVLAPLTLMKTVITQVATGTLTLASATEALKIAFTGLSRSGILLIVTAVATLAVEYYKLISAQSELSKSITLTGASFGMSTRQAEAFAANMAKSGGSTLQFMAILTDFAKAGAKADEVTVRLAKDLEKYAGQAADKTAESYAKLSEAPTKGLLDIAKAQGFVSKAILDKVHRLEEEGKTYEAIAVAQQAWKDSNQKAIDAIKSDLNPLQELWIKIKDGITSAGEAIYQFASSSAVVKVLTTAWETFAVIVAEVWFVLKQTVQTVIDLVNVLTAPIGTKLAVFEAAIEAAKKAREEHDKSIASILKRKEVTKGLTDEEVKQREANANAAKVAEDRWKKEKESTDFFQASMKSAKDLIIGTTQAQGELNDAERKYLEITNDPKYVKLTEARKKELKWLFDIAAVKVDQLKLDKMITEENLKLAEENNDLMLQAKLIGASDVERKRAIKTRKAEVELQKELVEIAKSSKGDVEAARAAAYERYAQKVKNANTEISIELANELTNSLTDAVMTGLTEGGAAGAKKLRSLIVAELMKPITVVVQAVIGNIVQGAVGSLTGSAATSAGGSFLTSATSSIIGSFAGKELAASFSSGALSSAYGAGFKASWGGTSAANTAEIGTFAGEGAAGTAAAGQAGYYSGMAAGALGGMALNRGISGDYKINNSVSTIQDIATIAATAIMGPVGGIIAGAASGLMNRAFGMGSKEVNASGISGTFSAKGANVQAYQKWSQSGGWFRSDKSGTDFSAVSSQLQDVLDFALGASTGLTTSFAKLIGATTEGISNFTKQIDISLQGLDAAGQQKAIEDAINAYGEDLASLIVGKVSETSIGAFSKSLNPLIKVGETASQALSRLANSLTSVNTILETLDHTLLTVSLTGAEAASKLADAFGGLDNFASATAAYYEAFYTEEERTAKTLERLQTAFSQLGLTLPTTLKGFRDIVDAQNLYTDSGRQTYAVLLGLSSAFASVTTTVTESVDKMKIATDATDAAFSVLESVINRQKKEIDKSINLKQKELDVLKTNSSALESSISTLTGLFDLLKTNINELYRSVTATSAMSLASARAFIGQSILSANATGVLPNEGELSDAISTVRNSIDKNYYKTKADAERERLLLANDLIQLQDLTRSQLSKEDQMLLDVQQQITLAETQIDVLNAQKTTLDSTLDTAKEQLNALRNVDTSLISLTTALNDFAKAVASESAVKAATAATASASSNAALAPYSINDSAADRQAKVQAQTGVVVSSLDPALVQAAKVLYQSTHGGASTAEYNAAAAAVGGNIGQALGWDGSIAGTENLRQIYGFASGGAYPGGLALVGEQGPELINFNQSGQVYTAGQTSNLLNNANLVTELQGLREEVQMLRYEARATAVNTGKAAKILDRAVQQGDAISVVIQA